MYFADVQEKRIFEDWPIEFDGRFRKFGHWPLSGVSGQVNAMLRTPGETKDRTAWGLVFRKLSMQKGIRKKMVKCEPFVAIGKKWLFELRQVHFAQPSGPVLTDIRKRSSDLDREAPTELLKGCRTPEGLRWRFLGENDVLMDDEQGLADGDPILAFRASSIVNTYQLTGKILRQPNAMDYAERLERDGQGLDFRGGFPLYLRTSDRELQNGFVESTRLGGDDTYDHTRRAPRKGTRIEKGKRNDPVGTSGRLSV